MGYRIGLIAADGEMKRRVESLYPEEAANGKLITIIMDNDRVEQQGAWLEDQGVHLIIGRSGSYERNVGNVSVPLLRLRVTAADIFTALVDASRHGLPMVLILWEQIRFDEQWAGYLPQDVAIYRFETGDQIGACLDRALTEHPGSIVVAEGVACGLARRKGIPYVFINASEDSIRDTFEYALELLSQLADRQYRAELLHKTVDSVRDAVIAVDRDGIVQLFSERAQDLLKIGVGRALGRPLKEVVPELGVAVDGAASGQEHREVLLQLGSAAVAYSVSRLVTAEELRGYLITFQDITRLQMMEKKIRFELHQKGMVARHTFADMVGEDEQMQDVIRQARIMAGRDSTVVIYGESGTGKEILAQSLHQESTRRDQPFVAVNCAALPESLLESELFGYEEGAFSGARKGGKPGLFELAHGGTIFLDEINSITPALQAKLLRVLEEREVMRIGSDYVIPLDVRILCAANEDLKKKVREGTFRPDLFYRLNSLELVVPPLRERPKDIVPLFTYFLGEMELDERIRWPEGEEIGRLMAYDWPGNVRELRSVAERYLLFDKIMIDALGADPAPGNPASLDLKEIHQLVEDRLIAQLLRSGLSKTEIAERLGISRTALWKKINR